MRPFTRTLLVLLVAAAPCAAAPDAARLEDVEAKVRVVARDATPKTVAIRVEKDGKALGFGSGAVISSDGLVLTCAHVTEPAAGGRLVAIFADGREAVLELVASNTRNDYSLCRTAPASKALPHFDLAPSDPAMGDYVVTLGHPGGPFADHLPSIAVGKVTGLHRKLPIWLQDKHYVDAIQTDAPIFGGNSGGPLVDLYGRLAGINGAILLAGDAAFTTPISQIAADLPALREGKAVAGKKIANLFAAMQELMADVDLADLEDAIADENLRRLLRMASAMQRPSDEDEDEAPVAKPRAARRRDELLAAFPLHDRNYAWRLRKDDGRVGLACSWRQDGSRILFVTSSRLVGDGKRLSVSSGDGAGVPARVLGRDGTWDLALLEAEGDPALHAGPHPFASDAAPGAFVLLEGLASSTFQCGVVAAVGREVGTDRRVPTLGIAQMLQPPNTSPFRPFPKMTQIDCMLEPDEFGGPVLRPDGSLVGIAVASFNPGCTFVVPAVVIAERLPGLLAGVNVPAPPNYGPEPRPARTPKVAAVAKARVVIARLWVPTLVGIARPARFRDPEKASEPKGPRCLDDTGSRPFDLHEGDVLVAIGETKIADAAAAKRALAELKEGAEVRVGVHRRTAENANRFETLAGKMTSGQLILSSVIGSPPR